MDKNLRPFHLAFPVLNINDRLLFARVEIGVAKFPTKTAKNDYFFFDSDSLEGISSDQIGPIAKQEIIGRVLVLMRK